MRIGLHVVKHQSYTRQLGNSSSFLTTDLLYVDKRHDNGGMPRRT